MAKKKKLSKGQSRRIKANHQKRIDKAKETEVSDVSWQNDNLGPTEAAVVISRFGQHADIETTDQEVLRCNIRRTVTSLVCGDEVIFRRAKVSDGDLAGVIEAVHERRTQLTRPDFYDGVKVVAANIDQILMVSAVVPEFTPQIIDRYLVACEDMGIEPILLLNKIDLLDQESLEYIDEVLDIYRELGYRVLLVSTKSGEGIDELKHMLEDKNNIFVGQSGVGKSTLVNTVLPNADILTKEVSENSGLGQHTTTVSRLHHLPSGGNLIDSPGIREFGLWHLDVERVTWCFKEFREFIGGCRFRDCKHLNDPGCLLREAVDEGKISELRFESYHRILESMADGRAGARAPRV
ncbi:MULTISPECIES: small ribosomal subunit biogenesis GTPase RsgA [Pseudoalteromonas]|uniref:Small ribosomal subunit biogenesis GTPase RsgA n=2 Tax=Pseudoalteromonas TaxID=53246 RepID=A0A8I2HE53_9GAMM|nr:MULTISPECIES: small ribosomal subunit biogenesis GTPase RsgA [Pseudoalteromonas]ATD08801.1 ribosome biogenesis GTPase [Pseudoalteromonas piscicida]KID36019.1 GTPase RsgA [Pseudoalteromonas flavipulchra NCIMB 2033 = ATCC BAA-314]MBD0780186.1 small ribosomal subunit biogenesis GTPase RsgA [Pseudoalteromonas flavipulchra]MBE0371431.1 ribosome biogenesis GTPase [Pseudoalteromonas flavipulchra NCIMB 2033 = ATCC BAA-314]MCO7199793.1 small ribosomal subunit biogenesis GTPase RsgA [Pseudoalteromona